MHCKYVDFFVLAYSEYEKAHQFSSFSADTTREHKQICVLGSSYEACHQICQFQY